MTGKQLFVGDNVRPKYHHKCPLLTSFLEFANTYSRLAANFRHSDLRNRTLVVSMLYGLSLVF